MNGSVLKKEMPAACTADLRLCVLRMKTADGGIYHIWESSPFRDEKGNR